jgi:WD40 repeat protein
MNLSDPSSIAKIGPHPGIDHVAISPNGRWVATATWSGSGGIHVWDAQTGERVTKRALEPAEAKTNVVFSPDSQRLAASTDQHHVAWDVATLAPIYRIPRNAHDEWPGPLTYSPDGKLLVAAHSRFVLVILDADTGQEIGVLYSPSVAGFHACCFSPDGRILAAASDTDIHLWDLGKIRMQLANINLDF